MSALQSLAPLKHPALARVAQQRHESLQLRVADAITTFAGSMPFIYIHALVFGVWCVTGLFGRDVFPFQLLTMVVSLEAIFLSTFVMIGQNRQAKTAEAKANHDFVEQEQELKINTELTKVIHGLAEEMHAAICAPKKS
jgi:uncharacterized membrane protein